MLAWKTITLLWPFLKELFLGKKTLREALKTNKGRVFFIGVIIGSFVVNMWAIPTILRMGMEFVDLKHKYEALSNPEGPPQSAAPAPAPAPTASAQKYDTLVKPDKVTDALPAAARSPASAPVVPSATVQQWSSYDATMARFNEIQARESGNKSR